MELGKNISLNNLLKEYDAIYLAIGANVPTEMKIQGEELKWSLWSKYFIRNR